MGIFDIYGLFDKFGIWGLVLGTFGIFYFFECKRKCSTFMGHLMELSPVWLTASLKCMGSLFAVFRVQQNPENGFQNSTIFREKNQSSCWGFGVWAIHQIVGWVCSAYLSGIFENLCNTIDIRTHLKYLFFHATHVKFHKWQKSGEVFNFIGELA